ncbi:hypothetical protein [Reichenbachiella faecimaris]|nr:hypothetical protein [Reichenbachiella faecimaris]
MKTCIISCLTSLSLLAAIPLNAQSLDSAIIEVGRKIEVYKSENKTQKKPEYYQFTKSVFYINTSALTSTCSCHVNLNDPNSQPLEVEQKIESDGNLSLTFYPKRSGVYTGFLSTNCPTNSYFKSKSNALNSSELKKAEDQQNFAFFEVKVLPYPAVILINEDSLSSGSSQLKISNIPSSTLGLYPNSEIKIENITISLSDYVMRNILTFPTIDKIPKNVLTRLKRENTTLHKGQFIHIEFEANGIKCLHRILLI